MTDKCSAIHQGYPSITTHTDCAGLANTGTDLYPMLLLALMLLVAGTIIVLGPKFSESRRRRRKLRALGPMVDPDERIARQAERERRRQRG